MKSIALFIMTFFIGNLVEPDISKVRSLFENSANDKDSAAKMLQLLSNPNDKNNALMTSYLGAAEMMQANYKFNPITKFSKFQKGKKLIEQAVFKEPKNIEIRFVRFAIQTNLPSFLNYDQHINQDKIYMINNLKTVTDKELKMNIIKYLSSSTYCTEQEKNNL